MFTYILHFFIGNYSEQNSENFPMFFLKAGAFTSISSTKKPQRHSPGQNHCDFSASRSPHMDPVWGFQNASNKCPSQNSCTHGGVSKPSQHFPRRCGLLGRVLVPVRGSKRNADSCSGSHASILVGKTHVTS